jgi:hypothetical protein
VCLTLNNNIQDPFKEQSEAKASHTFPQVEADKRYTHHKVAVVQNYDNAQPMCRRLHHKRQ